MLHEYNPSSQCSCFMFMLRVSIHGISPTGSACSPAKCRVGQERQPKHHRFYRITLGKLECMIRMK